MQLIHFKNQDHLWKKKAVIPALLFTLTIFLSGLGTVQAVDPPPPPGTNGGNVKKNRVQTASGEFTKKTVTVKQNFYIKATALVKNSTNRGTTEPPPVSTSLAGHWATVDEAKNAFNASYNSGPLSVIGAISVDPLGPDEIISGPTDTYQVATERSAPKSQAKITADAQANPAWLFVEWIGEPPPKCEIAGNSVSQSPVTGNTTTTTVTTQYTWTSNWKEVEK